MSKRPTTAVLSRPSSRRNVRSVSLRALAVAAHLERGQKRPERSEVKAH